MNSLFRYMIFWSLSASVVWAQESAAIEEANALLPQGAPTVSAGSPIQNAPRVSEPDEPALTRATKASEATEIRIFALQSCRAADTARLLQELISSATFRAVADERSNSVIATGTVEQLQTIEAVLRQLDEPGETPAVREDVSSNEAARLLIQLQDELTVLQQSTVPQHPKVRQLQARIDAARQAAPATSQNSPPTRGTLPALQAARRQMEHINDELRLADINYERMEKLVEAGNNAPSELDQARLKVLAARARLSAFEEQIAAVKERMKADLLRMMEESLSNWLQSGGTEKSGIKEREARIPGIIELVGQSPEEARKAAVDFANELDRESIERIEAEVASFEQQINEGEAYPFSGTHQEQQTRRLAELRRGLRARSLLSGTDSVSEGLQPERPQTSFTQAVAESELNSFTKVSSAELRRQFEQADLQTRALAAQLAKDPDPGKRDEFRKSVQRTFLARQSLLRAELTEMQARLLRTQRSIDSRERIADQIIDRRVEELLNTHPD